MDAWETLISNSTVSGVDAWTHLNNQQGGGGGVTIEVGAIKSKVDDIIKVNPNDSAISVRVADGGFKTKVADDTIKIKECE